MSVPTEQVTAALTQVARLGAFFDLIGLPNDGLDAPESWRPLPELLGPSGSAVVEQAIDRLAARLGSPDLRPVASMLHMSAAAQLCSPLLATAVEHGLVPQLQSEHLVYGFTAAGGLRLRLTEGVAGRSGSSDQLAVAMREQLVSGPLAVLTARVKALVPLSPQVTNGNVASTLAAAAALLDGPAGSRTREFVAALLDGDPLTGAGKFTATGFRRNNCCLFYRIPGGGTCGDCVLTA